MNVNVIISKFEEWAGEKSPEDSRINIFNHIRDIPYAVIQQHFTLEKAPVGMLLRKQGSCTPKHYLMGRMFEMLGLNVQYCTYPFRWEGMGVEYPDVLKDIGSRIAVTYHLACKIRIEDKWILTDGTWDIGLKKAGFPTNDEWDGFSDTRLAVKPLEEYSHDSAEEREEFIQGKYAEYTLPEKLELSRFALELNKWLETIRKT